MVQDSPSRKQDQYIVRFPTGMRDRLKREAANNGRSLNAEIIQRLEASFPAPLSHGEPEEDDTEVDPYIGTMLTLFTEVIKQGARQRKETERAMREAIRKLKAGQPRED